MSWEYVKVSDLTEVITGGTPSTTKKEYWEGGNIPWLNSGELNQEIVVNCDNYISELGMKNSAARIMPKDTVLIALTGATTGVVGYLTFEACANQSVTGILPSKNHHPKYLYYYLKSIRQKVLDESYGGAQKHISQGYVKNLEIPLPPLATQKRIAEILDAADGLRRKDQELLKKYDELAQAIFIDMFGDPVKNEKGWEILPISEVVHPERIITYGIVQAGEHIHDGVPYIKTGDIKDGEILTNQLQRTSKEIALSYRRSQLFKGDIVMSIRATVGTVALLPDILEGANLTQGTARISPSNLIDRTYLYYYLKNDFAQNWISSYAKGATFREITLSKLRELPVLLPPIQFQTIFRNKLKLLVDGKGKNKELIHSSSVLFDSLIQKAFKGELVA